MPVANVSRLSFTTRRKVWEFPKDKFCRYEASDELWARPLGFGREIEVKDTLVIPNAVITECGPNRVTFKAIPEHSGDSLVIGS